MTATELLQQMDELLAAYQSLLDAANRKRQIIRDQQVNELAACFHEELQLMERIQELQSAWQTSAQQFLAARSRAWSGDGSSEVSIDDVVNALRSEEGSDRMKEAQEQLTALVEEIKQCNQQNRQLIDHSLEYIDYMVEAYRYGGEQDVTYQHPTNQQVYGSGGQASRFESRA